MVNKDYKVKLGATGAIGPQGLQGEQAAGATVLPDHKVFKASKDYKVKLVP